MDLMNFIGKMLIFERARELLEQILFTLRNMFKELGLDCIVVKIMSNDYFFGFPENFSDELFFNDLGEMYNKESNSIHINLEEALLYDTIETLTDVLHKHIDRLENLLIEN